jgi:hypothetical protein
MSYGGLGKSEGIRDMAAEKRYLFTLERRTHGERRGTNDRRSVASRGADLYQRLEDMRAAVASDRRRWGRRVTDRHGV